MGKKDGGNRTKGNAKVASSARSAQILGNNATGFIGFGTNAESGFVPLLQSDDGVPPDFRLVMRKMLKKDTTTKVKALQEFLELSLNSTEDIMVSVLPFWPAVYNKLAVDTDHRVRELTHVALKHIVAAVGKNLAPHLKSLSGTWFIGQSDSHAPAADAALAAWQAAFPDPAKSTGAKEFCGDDIFSLIFDNLILATPQSLSDPKTTSPEEMESKYERTLCMSLTSYIKLMESVKKLNEEKQNKLLDSPKFWKYGKHKAIKVRRSFFSMLTQLCQKMPQSLAERGSKIAPAVLTCLGDQDAGVTVWEASYHLLGVLQNPWTLVNSWKAVFPGIWTTLKTAAGGKPEPLFPLLMPFLEKLGIDAMQDKEKFINQWFSYLNEGLALLKAKKSPSCGVVTKTIIECIFYLCNKCDLPQTVKSNLINDHLITIVTEESLGRNIASCLLDYLMFWNRSAGGNTEIAQCNQYFWSSLHYICTQKQTVGPVLQLYTCLPKDTEIVEIKKIATDIWKQQLQSLKDGNNICESLLILNSILESFGHQDKLLGSQQDLITVYNDSVLKIAGNLEAEDSVTRFTWALAASVQIDSGLKLLQSFTEVYRPLAVGKLLQRAVESRKSPELLEKCLTNQGVQTVLVTLVEKIIEQLESGQSLNQENWTTVSQILKYELSLPHEFQHKLINLTAQSLQHHSTKPKLVDNLCELTALMAKSRQSIVATAENGKSLVKSIFNIDTDNFEDIHVKSVDRCWESITVIHPDFIEILATELQQLLSKEITMINLERLVVKSEKLVKIAAKKSEEILCSTLEIIFAQVDYNLSQVVWYHVLFHQRLFYPSCSERLEEALFQQSRPEPENLILANRSLVFLTILQSVYEIKLDGDDERTIPEEERIHLKENFINSNVMDNLLDCTTAVVYMNNLVQDTNSSQDIRNLEARLSRSATVLFSRLSKKTLDIIEQRIFEKCNDNDVMYSLGLSWLLGVTYRYSDWDLRLNRFIKPEEEDFTKQYNILITLLRLSSRFNLGTGSLSSYVSLATGQLMSIGGLKTDEGTCLLWFISSSLELVRSGSRLHVSGVADLSGEVKVLLEMVRDWKEESEADLLYSSDVSLSPWPIVNRVCSVINLLNLTVTKFQEHISSEIWDLIMCSLVQWVASCEESRDSLCSRPGCLMFGIAVSKLVTTVSKALRRRGAHPALSQGPLAEKVAEGNQEVGTDVFVIPNKLRDEWEDFFAEGIFTVLVPLYIKVSTGKEELYSCSLLCSSLGEAIIHTPLPLLLQCDLPPLYMVQDVDAAELPDNLTFLLNNFGPKLSCSYRSFQVAAAHILAAITKEIAGQIDATSDTEECEIPRRLLEIMTQGEMVLSSLLSEFSICDSVPEMPSGTVAFSQSLGYLLCWRVVLCLLDNSSDIVRPRFSQFLDNHDHISTLLGNIFKLLPTNSSRLQDIFVAGDLEVERSAVSCELEELAASCWTQVCRHLPAFARQWWSRLDKESQSVVEKLTCNHVTPALWSKEVEIISSSEKSENLTIKVRESVKEVVATYSIDEGSMELVVTLPSNYPLGGVTVDSTRRVGVETGQWRKWMLQLTTFLTHQNGSIYEGLNLWKNNVDKRFEGVEECYICFYILHGSNHQLPKLGCRTCKKKFHSACLYKWFSTSNNSSCPLCRNLF